MAKAATYSALTKAILMLTFTRKMMLSGGGELSALNFG